MEDPRRGLAAYGKVPHHLAYPECSIYHSIMATYRDFSRLCAGWPSGAW